MTCEYELCIYNRDFSCIVDNPEINSLGMCDVCIIIDIDKKFLEKEKERQLAKFEEEWGDN